MNPNRIWEGGERESQTDEFVSNGYLLKIKRH